MTQDEPTALPPVAAQDDAPVVPAVVPDADDEVVPRSSQPMVVPSRDALERALQEIRHRGPDLFFRIVLVGVFASLVAPMATPLVLGGAVAVLLNPLKVRLAGRLGRAAPAAPGIVTGAAVLGVVLPLIWIAWSALAALRAFVNTLVADGADETRMRMAGTVARAVGRGDGEDAIVATVTDATNRMGVAVGQWLAATARALPEGITNTFLFVLTLYFGLRDGPRLVAWLDRVSPFSDERTAHLFEAVQRSVHGTMLGMLVVATVQGGLALVAMLITRVDHALLWGFVAAIASALPIVGTTPVTVGAAIFLYGQGRPGAAAGMLFAALLIGVTDNIVRPWVQSQHDDIHPLLALLAIFGGLAVFGPAGLLLGPVLASMAVWAVESYRD